LGINSTKNGKHYLPRTLWKYQPTGRTYPGRPRMRWNTEFEQAMRAQTMKKTMIFIFKISILVCLMKYDLYSNLDVTKTGMSITTFWSSIFYTEE
jgi:hypothetical protein